MQSRAATELLKTNLNRQSIPLESENWSHLNSIQALTDTDQNPVGFHPELKQNMSEYAKQTGTRVSLAVWYAKFTFNLSS